MSSLCERQGLECVKALDMRAGTDAKRYRMYQKLRDCSDPRCFRCLFCNYPTWARCDSSAGRCKGCARRYKLRVKQLAGEGAERATVVGARLMMLTLTAPGEGTDLDAWNDSLPQRWSWFVTEVRRLLPKGATVEFLKTYEYQKRGALHVHALVAVRGAVSRRTVRDAFYCARGVWDFGKQWKLDDATAEAAWYIAKYVSKHASEMPRGSGRRVWSCSRRWGSMRAVREKQRLWAIGSAAPQSSAPGGPRGAAGTDLDPNTGTYAKRECGPLVLDSVAGTLAV